MTRLAIGLALGVVCCKVGDCRAIAHQQPVEPPLGAKDAVVEQAVGARRDPGSGTAMCGAVLNLDAVVATSTCSLFPPPSVLTIALHHDSRSPYTTARDKPLGELEES